MDIPWFQRFLGKMDPFHIKFGLEGNGALEPWKFHGIEFQTSNIAYKPVYTVEALRIAVAQALQRNM
jgi:hypothetical protein